MDNVVATPLQLAEFSGVDDLDLTVTCQYGGVAMMATLSVPEVEPLYIQDENGEAVVFIPYGSVHA